MRCIWKKILESGDIGQFYKHVNRRLSCPSGVASLIGADGGVITNDDRKASMLNEYFASVCTSNDGTLPPLARAVPTNVALLI